MLKSQKGSTLIAVMLVFLVLTTLLLVLLAANIGGAKRTETRETDITENLDALAAIKEGVAVTQAFITNNSPTLLASNTTYDAKLKKFMDEENAKNIGYKLKDVTSDDTTLTDGFTRALNVTSPPYSQLVYVTATPSFLKYALGSRSNLTMNGSPSIQGDIYSRYSLNISNEALYRNKKNLYSISTYLPVSKHAPGTRSEVIIEEGTLNLCKTSIPNSNSEFCYKQVPDLDPATKNIELYKYIQKEYNWAKTEQENITLKIKEAFSEGDPLYAQIDAPFADIDIHSSFTEKLRKAGYKIGDYDLPLLRTKAEEKVEEIIIAKELNLEGTETEKEIQKKKAIEKELDILKTEHIIAELTMATTSIDFEKIINDFDDIDLSSDFLFYKGSPNIDVKEINLDKNQWLVIDGDANLENIGEKPLDIKGNILVTGDLKLSGLLSFDSVIYVLGNTTIRNAAIHCYKNSCTQSNYDESNIDNPAFILMTQGNLDINLVNKFKNDVYTGINGYLYTASLADVYAVGSTLNVTGGLFSKDNLTINSFRGNAAEGTPELTFEEKADIEFSRFKIVNNKRLFFDQEDALPKVKQLSAVPDRLEKDN